MIIANLVITYCCLGLDPRNKRCQNLNDEYFTGVEIKVDGADEL